MKKGGFNIIIHSVKVMMRDVSGMLCMQTYAIKLQLFAASRFIEAKSRRELNLELLATPSHSEVHLKFRFQVPKLIKEFSSFWNLIKCKRLWNFYARINGVLQKSQIFQKIDSTATNLFNQNQIQIEAYESVTRDSKFELTLAVIVGIHWPYEP